MSITVTETDGHGMGGSAYDSYIDAIDPDIESLPEDWKQLFEGPVKLLMGSKVALAILPARLMYPMIELSNFILSLLKYPDFIGYDPHIISLYCAEYFNILSTTMSHQGKFLLQGPMSQRFSTQTSKFLGVGAPPEEFIREGRYP